MINMWVDYYKERVGGEVVWKDGVGFIAYRIKNGECFIDEAYIAPEFRRTKEITAILEEVVTAAKESGCDYIGANVFLNTLNAKESLAASMGCGFYVTEGVGKVLALRKDI